MTDGLILAMIPLLWGIFAFNAVIGTFYQRLTHVSPETRRYRAILREDYAAAPKEREEERHRKKSIDSVLKALDEKQEIAQRRRPSLSVRLRQAGFDEGPRGYYMASAAVGATAFALLLLVIGLNGAASAGFAVASALALPHMVVSNRRKQRFRRFVAELPSALDVIVRGVKSGLPLTECLRIVASEAQEPVRSEIDTMLADQSLGMPVDEAARRLAERVPLPETNFFAIVLSIQARSGGSLSEAIGNLSRVLRERKKIENKVKSMSAEAKSSAGIIGALPFLVGAVVYLTTPEYIGLLFATITGKIALSCAVIWMLIGVLVMRKMINFKI